MWPYLITFSISAWLIEYANRRRKKYIIALALLLPALLAGFRDISVGFDTSKYLLSYFQRALNSNSLFNYSKIMSESYDNPGLVFNIIVYFAKMVSHNMNFLMFLLEAITLIFVYLGFDFFKREINVSFAMLLFYLFYYNVTYNAMKQMLAIAICFFAFRYVCNKKFFHYLLWVTVAMLCHTTAAVSIILYFIYQFVTNKKFKIVNILIIIIVTCGLFLSYQKLVQFLLEYGLVSSKYSIYIDSITFGSDFSFFATVTNVTLIMLMLYINVKFKKYDEKKGFYILCTIEETIIMQLSMISLYASRISLYFILYKIIFLSFKYTSINKQDRRVLYIISLTIALVYWIVIYVIYGENSTVPYIWYWK